MRGAPYTEAMKLFVTAKPAARPRTDTAAKAALIYAFILVVMAVCQLFTFEDFTTLIESYALPFAPWFIAALPAFIVAMEVFALPFLLRMTLSDAFRWLSLLCGWIVPLLWVIVSGWSARTLSGDIFSTIGFLGSLGSIPVGWWAVGFSLSMALLAAWASWGMWPLASRKSSAQ